MSSTSTTTRRTLGRGAGRPIVLAALAVGVLVLGHAFTSALPSWRGAQSIISLSLFITVIALGQGLVMLTGGLDLSVPGVIALSATTTALGTSQYHWNLVFAVLLGLLASLLVGAFNGFLVARFKVPAFIITLAVQGILVGLTTGWTYGHESPASPNLVVTLFSGSGKFLGVQLPVFFFVLVTAFGYLLQTKGRFGRNSVLLGSSPEAARIAGRPTGRILVSIYALCGLGGGIAGVMLLGFSGNAQLDLGTEWVMPSISAVLVGGTIIGSGRGQWQSTAAAAVLLTAIAVVIGATSFSQGWQTVLYGVVVLIALLASRIVGSRRR